MDGLDRWRILRLHVEDDIPLTALARETGTALRTLERWHHLYKSGGIAALEPQRRTDAGTRRTPTELVAFVERLALTRPVRASPRCTGSRSPKLNAWTIQPRVTRQCATSSARWIQRW